eukprot:11491914-Alexandrium_andersonii.AAC.1
MKQQTCCFTGRSRAVNTSWDRSTCSAWLAKGWQRVFKLRTRGLPMLLTDSSARSKASLSTRKAYRP